jgi:hexosaminidase
MFPEIWVASSYKGSSGETTTMTYVGHHHRNQQTWLETMYIAHERYKVNFTGIAVTGWSRYDHMLALCELIPSSIPSLAYALQTIVHGRLTQELNKSISDNILGCLDIPLWERPSFPMFTTCSFPGKFLFDMS